MHWIDFGCLCLNGHGGAGVPSTFLEASFLRWKGCQSK